MAHIRLLVTAVAFRALVLAPVAIASAASLSAQDKKHSQAIDAMFARWNRDDSPGAAVLVVHEGKVVHRQGYGMADLQHGVKITPSTVFDIASVSKQFCGLAVAMLIEQKKLGIDDDVRKHVPSVPDFDGRKITIRHLVHHTSGIRDWPGALRVAGWRFDDVISFEQILNMLRHQRHLNFDPGSRHLYSNTGYNLLAHVVEKHSGVSFATWTKGHLFDPLGMRDTHFHDDHTRVVPNRAVAYQKSKTRWNNIGNQLTAVGSSSLFTTIDDLAKWILNFETKKIGGKAAIARMHTKGVLNDGREITYCYGVTRNSFRGIDSVQHTGSWAGFHTILARFPGERFAVVVLANTATVHPRHMAFRIAELYLADALQPELGAGAFARRATERKMPSADEMRQLVGHYYSREFETTYTIALVDGKLTMQHFRNETLTLRPAGGDRFSGSSWWAGTVQFVRDDKNRVNVFLVSSGRCLNMRFDRVPSGSGGK